MGRTNTHDIELRPDVVVKTYRLRAKDASAREWRALNVLSQYAPCLAPQPLKADLAADPPYVVMTRVAGTPVQEPVSAQQVEAMAEALHQIQESVPRTVLADLPARCGTVPEFVTDLRNAFLRSPNLGPHPVVAHAFGMAGQWLRRPEIDEFAAEIDPVLGTGDGNVANFLWDGTRMRVIDFEYAGRSDRTFELAEVVEHISVWCGAGIEAGQLTGFFELSPMQAARLRQCRRLLAIYWLLALLPDSPGHKRNPPGTLQRQSTRLLELLDG